MESFLTILVSVSLSFVVGMFAGFSMNINKEYHVKMLEAGAKMCEARSGLSSYDLNKQLRCQDGTEITLEIVK